MPSRWDRELKDAGFTGAGTIVYDAEYPFQYCAAIVASLCLERPILKHEMTVLCTRPEEGVSQKLIKELEQAGWAVTVARLGDNRLSQLDIISTLDLETRFFENITSADFKAFQDLLRTHNFQKLLWLMPPTQMHCDDPRSAQTIGTFRAAREELATPLHTLEISVTEAHFSKLIMKIFDKIRSRRDIDRIDPDREFAVDNGVIKIGRYQPFSLERELSEKSLTDSNHMKILQIKKPGLLNTLGWIDKALSAKIGDHEVEVETRAIGLTFRVSYKGKKTI